jgi:hypothetical protein
MAYTVEIIGERSFLVAERIDAAFNLGSKYGAVVHNQAVEKKLIQYTKNKAIVKPFVVERIPQSIEGFHELGIIISVKSLEDSENYQDRLRLQKTYKWQLHKNLKQRSQLIELFNTRYRQIATKHWMATAEPTIYGLREKIKKDSIMNRYQKKLTENKTERVRVTKLNSILKIVLKTQLDRLARKENT